jgi:hypothetical protein
MERAFKGVWIPAEIWLNEELSVMEKVLYAEIDSFCGSGKECFCSNAHFAHLLQVSERQVQRLLVSLEKKGIISRRMVYKEGGKEVDKRYLKPVHVTTPPDKTVTTPPDEIVTPSGDENVVGTNPGITNSYNNTPLTPQVDAKVSVQEERFDTFWKAYPKKVGKGAAKKAFIKAKVSDNLLSQMLTAIETQRRTHQWQKENGQFIPNPSTWLNQSRWEDEPQGVETAPKAPSISDILSRNEQKEREKAEKQAWLDQQIAMREMAKRM